MALTQEQRAKRRTKKINNRVAKSMPLFAGTSSISQFLTDEATQLEAIKAWDAFNEKWFAQLDEKDRSRAIEAERLREQLSRLVSPDVLREFDERLASLKEKWIAYRNNPCYVVDYWRTLLNEATSGEEKCALSTTKR